MNSKHLITLGALLVGVAQSSAVTYTFFQDTLTTLDVKIEGVGDTGGFLSQVSPSGIWQVGGFVNDVGLGNVGEINGLVQRLLPVPEPIPTDVLGPVHVEPPDLPRTESAVNITGDALEATFTLNSGVNVVDWNWTLHLRTKNAVPDSGSTLLLFATASACLGALRLRLVR